MRRPTMEKETEMETETSKTNPARRKHQSLYQKAQAISPMNDRQL